jgi:Flp pilus assembly protein TadG
MFPAQKRQCSLPYRFQADTAGTTAIEFGLLVVPFVMLLVGTITISIYFFTQMNLSTALASATRTIRTGALQSASGAYAGAATLPQQLAVLRNAICKEVAGSITCNDIVFLAQSGNAFANVAAPACAVNGAAVSQTTANQTFNAGGANSVVLITACYPWKLGARLPFVPKVNLVDGAMMLQASVVIRVEPYN